VASLGDWDQVVTTSSVVAWTTRNALHIDTSNGTAEHIVAGPAGSWATSIAISPDGRIAAVWAPRPGSPGARNFRSIADKSSVAIIDPETGSSMTVRGSAGATGPVAWTPDGSRVFFGESPHGGSAGLATYLLSTAKAQHLELPGVSLPEHFGPPTGSIYLWDEG
jgi:hypothetical protein